MAVSNQRKYIPFYIDEAAHRVILVYAAETGQTIQEVVKSVTDEATQSLYRLVAQINEMRKQSYLKTLQEEEARKASIENPLIVPGHEVEPISI